MIISAQGITKAFGGKIILSGVSFSIEEGEKAAFVGVNGAGKTTLFKIISGSLAPDSGSAYIPKGVSVSYLEQGTGLESGLSVYEEMLSTFQEEIEAEEEMRSLERRMGDAGEEEYDRLFKEYGEVSHFFEQRGGYGYKSLARGVIAGLGLDGDKKIGELSGGQKTRAALAKALLKKPDALLLDEPTNHLDISAINWLENYLKSYPKTVLFVSHDRYFIDRVASKVIEIENGGSTEYNGAYSYYIEHKRESFEAALKRRKDEERELAKQMESARLLRSYNREKSVKRAASIEKRISKTELLERPRETERINLSLAAGAESGRDVLALTDISGGYGGRRVLSDVSFEIKKDEKVALIGGNGVGKTTLLRLITGAMAPQFGKVRLGANVKIGYYDQERRNLSPSKTVMEHIRDTYPKLTDGEIRNILAAFLFKGDDVFKQISALSGGEKGRVCLAEIILSGANLLILDEPTNDLDIFSREALESALVGYTGTLLCVSHDRYFINSVADRVLELTESGVKGYLGDYDYYLRKKAEDEEERRLAEETVKAAPTDKIAKSTWLERKAETAEARRRAAALKRLEHQIEETEEEIAKCDELLCLPEVFSDHLKARETHDAKLVLETELERLYAEWEKADSGEN